MRTPGFASSQGAVIIAVALSSPTALAESIAIEAGEVFTLVSDITLEEDDHFEAMGAAGDECVIEGAGHSILSADSWSGRFTLSHCRVVDLGTDESPALELHATDADVSIEGTTFDASGQIVVQANGESKVVVRKNTIMENSRVPAVKALADSRPVFRFSGFSPERKYFQGNRVLHGWVMWENGRNWVVGGKEPGEGNILTGVRAGLEIWADEFHVVGNYVHTHGHHGLQWNQVKTFIAHGEDLLVEHNVFRRGDWVVGGFTGGEFRYNLIGDSQSHPWMILDSDGETSVHHNVFIRNFPDAGRDGIQVLYEAASPSTEFYNNTLHGGGDCWRAAVGPAVVVAPGGRLRSLRSNAFAFFRTDLGSETALVRAGRAESGQYEPKASAPDLLDYADYNLFFSPSAAELDNYGATAGGRAEREEPGFALNDVPAGGDVDAQVEPGFTGPIPVAFPYADESVLEGNSTVCQILRYYRSVFTPRAGSPMVDTGDPADGAGNDIGAVAVGPSSDSVDGFGLLCAGDGADFGEVLLTPETLECPEEDDPMTQPDGIDGGVDTGGQSNDAGLQPGDEEPKKDVVVVCSIPVLSAAGREAPASYAGLLLLGAVALLRRRRGNKVDVTSLGLRKKRTP